MVNAVLNGHNSFFSEQINAWIVEEQKKISLQEMAFENKRHRKIEQIDDPRTLSFTLGQI